MSRFAATRPTRSDGMAFHLLHERCGSRIQNRSYCPVCNVVVPRQELVRGFRVRKRRVRSHHRRGVEGLREPGRTGDRRPGVPSHHGGPRFTSTVRTISGRARGARGYQLLRHAMAKTGRVTVPKYTMRGKQRLVLLRPVGEGSSTCTGQELHLLALPELTSSPPSLIR
jgi:DNA end-binding protein Ku